MIWTVAYYHQRGLPLEFRTSHEGDWRHLPPGDGITTGVAYVDVWHGDFNHRLSGHDYYWIDCATMTFGMFNDPSNWRWYGGTPADQYIAWRWVRGGSERVIPALALPTAHILNGVTLPDADARTIGLLGPHDSLPPRPH